METLFPQLCNSLLVMGSLVLLPGLSAAQIANPHRWATKAPAHASLVHGNTSYVGGEFTDIGPATGGFAAINAMTGTLRSGWPSVDGAVIAIAPDGAGGCYIGGYFSGVAGVPRRNLAHIHADGSLDGWNPGVNGMVFILAVSGNTVYVGGDFTSIGGQSRSGIAALDATTGLATAWNPGASGPLYAYVSAVAVSGNTVYAGGDYSGIGGEARSFLAALDATTGLATGWNPEANDIVSALVVRGNTVYAAGWFSSIGGQARSRIAALDAKTGQATAWNPGTNDAVRALAVSGNTVYAGGDFTSIGGQARAFIAALDATTGQATAWNPGASGVPYPHVVALDVGGSTVYAGGDFTRIGGQARSYIAALDAKTGQATEWNPGANDAVVALVARGNTVYAGGFFSSIGEQASHPIAGLSPARSTAHAVATLEPVAAEEFAFSLRSPNPVRAASATIAYAVPQRTHVRLTVLDVQGREVAVLANEERQAGRHTASLAANRLQAGLYFVRLQAPGADLSWRVAIIP